MLHDDGCPTKRIRSAHVFFPYQNLYALGAIALWASRLAGRVAPPHIPPFLLTGITLIIGSVLSAYSYCCAIVAVAHSPAHASAGRLWSVLRTTSCCSSRCGMRRRWRPTSSALWPVHRGAGPSGVARRGAAGRMSWQPCWGLAGRRLPSWAAANWRLFLAWGCIPAAAAGIHLGLPDELMTKRVGLPHHHGWLVRAGSGALSLLPCAAGAQRDATRRATGNLLAVLGLGPLGGAFTCGMEPLTGRCGASASWASLRWRPPRC